MYLTCVEVPSTMTTSGPVLVIVGGGIAGVTCAQELSRLNPDSRIILISSSPLIKAAVNFVKVSRSLEVFDVCERGGDYLTETCPNVTVIHSTVTQLNLCHQIIHWTGGCVHYHKLCICTGGIPSVIPNKSEHVMGIRDTESVLEFQKRLGNARRIVVVGNGGIAIELVYEVRGCEVVWVIKDKSIGHTFFDGGAATFFLPHLSESSSPDKVRVHKRTKYTVCGGSKGEKGECGSALGPDWSVELSLTGRDKHEGYPHVSIEYECTVTDILTPGQLNASGLHPSDWPHPQKPKTEAQSSDNKRETPPESADSARGNLVADGTTQVTDWPVFVRLSNGRVYGCDVVVSATGVSPNTGWLREAINDDRELKLAEDGGIIVDTEMRSSVPSVYAAGDVCSVDWRDHSRTWFPMRLWTQARQMGAYAAKCMDAHLRGEDVMLDFCFELFAHVTRFFGHKVALLGCYNGQGLGTDHELIIRTTKGVEYIKVVLVSGRMVGAVLIGDTDLEETFENLILNGMDLSRFGESLLDPGVDIEDYFD